MWYTGAMCVKVALVLIAVGLVGWAGCSPTPPAPPPPPAATPTSVMPTPTEIIVGDARIRLLLAVQENGGKS